MKLFNRDNIFFYNDSFISLIDKIKQDIIFIDPPWGGPNYKEIKKLRIELPINDNKQIGTEKDNLMEDESLSKNIENKKTDENKETSISLEDICLIILKQKYAKMIALKLPVNYDMDFLKSKIKNKLRVFILKNMMLVIIFN